MPLLKTQKWKDIKRVEQQERRCFVDRLSFMRGDRGYLTPRTAFAKRSRSVLNINDQALLHTLHHYTSALR